MVDIEPSRVDLRRMSGHAGSDDGRVGVAAGVVAQLARRLSASADGLAGSAV